jgi:hypothetical protein
MNRIKISFDLGVASLGVALTAAQEQILAQQEHGQYSGDIVNDGVWIGEWYMSDRPDGLPAYSPVTPQQTYDHILGSGALQWEWFWQHQDTTGYDSETTNVTPDWSETWTMYDGDHDDSDHVTTVKFDHQNICAAIVKIAAGEVIQVSGECEKQCAQFLVDPDYADFDACSADEVLQVVAYGHPVYS